MSTVPLVRADVWDPATIEARRRQRADELFLAKYRDGTIDPKDPANRERAFSLIERYEAERVARQAGS